MIHSFALAGQSPFWAQPTGTAGLWIGIILSFLAGMGMMFAFLYAPARARRPIVMTFTFLAGLFFVLYWLWPTPQDREANQIPVGMVEGVGFWLEDAVGPVGKIANIITSFLLGLGVFSLLRLHITRFAKMQKDWAFSALLLFSMVLMIIFGYWDWIVKNQPNAPDFALVENWGLANYGRDLLFDGLLQKMDAGMFSIIAFYILSAAYRAFRIRSVEATILLATALIVMLSLLGAVELMWANGVNAAFGDGGFSDNLKLTEIYGFIRRSFQTPGIRAIDFGIGVGALAMALRLWLSLERGGATT
jgi:hypothetical protein